MASSSQVPLHLYHIENVSLWPTPPPVEEDSEKGKNNELKVECK